MHILELIWLVCQCVSDRLTRFPPKSFITSTTSFNPSVRIAYQEDPVGVQVELVPNVLKNRISGGVENVNTDFALKKCFQNFQKLLLSI